MSTLVAVDSDSDDLAELEPDLYNEGCYIHDFPYGGPYSDMLSDAQMKVLDIISTDRAALRYQNSSYIFIPAMGQWYYSHSTTACRYLSEHLGLEKVSVNFYIAVEPYVDTIHKLSDQIEDIPESICIGTFRLSIKVDEVSVSYSPIYNVAFYSGNDLSRIHMRRMSAFVYKSIHSSRIPGYVECNFVSKAEVMMSNVLDSNKMNVLKWVIGNALIDPVKSPRILYLYGAGGDGKTEVINAILANTVGCSNALSRDYVGNCKSKVAEDDIRLLLTSRIATFGDCILEDGYKVGTEFLKMITSGDSISTGTISGRVECTGVFASNNVWYPSKGLMEQWFVRRVILLDFPPLRPGLPKPPTQYNDIDIMQFVTSCVKVRKTMDHPPVTIRTALYTIFGSKAQSYTRGIIYKDNSSRMECLSAAWVVAAHAGIDVDHLVSLVEHINSDLVERSTRCVRILNVSTLSPT